MPVRLEPGHSIRCAGDLFHTFVARRLAAAAAVWIGLAVAAAGQVSATTLLSEDTSGNAGGGAGLVRNPGSSADMSPDGRFVLFTSTASDLVTGITDTNSAADVFLRDLQENTTVILSVTADGTALGTVGNNALRNFVFSPDSRSLLFRTQATGIVAGLADTNSAPDVFVRDLLAGATACVSINAAGTATGNSTSDSTLPPVFRPDGRAIAFVSLAGDLVEGVVDLSGRDLFLHDLDEHSTTLVSVTALGGAGAGIGSEEPWKFNADGRYLAFVSSSVGFDASATDLNGGPDLFVRDLQAEATHLVSRTIEDAAAGTTTAYEWTPDGHAVLFPSQAATVVSGVTDTNGAIDLFLWHSDTQAVEMVSVDAAGTAAGNKVSRPLGVSPDGRFVAFGSASTNLTAESAGGDVKDDLYVRDTEAHTTAYVARNETFSVVFPPLRFSPDGEHLLFESDASDVLDGVADNNGDTDLFLYQLLTGEVLPVTVNFAGTAMAASNGTSDDDIVLSPNGRYVSFVSDATDLVAGFTHSSTRDLYVRDLEEGATTLVTEGLDGSGVGYDQAAVRDAEFSTDNRFLLLIDKALLDDQVSTPFNFNFSNNLYAYDVVLHARTMLSVNAAGTAPAGSGVVPFELGVEPFSFLVSPAGGSVLFLSTAADMVAGVADTPATMDFFLGSLPTVESPCGDPVFDAQTPGTIKASDALFVLKAGVGTNVCELCVCDVNDSGTITAGDGLLTLKVAVGQGVVLVCPICE